MPIVFVNQPQHYQHVEHQAPAPPPAPAPQPPLILRQQLLQQQPSRHQYYTNDQTISPNKASMEAIKICVVCGDRANGYNFNVIACESCKAFFRRNALRKKDFKCPFNGNCKIDAITRKFCQKCRLQKCFNSGMKKDLILTDEEKRIIKFKIAENKQKRVKLSDSPNGSVDSTTAAHVGRPLGPLAHPPPHHNSHHMSGVIPTGVPMGTYTANQYLSQIIMNSNNTNISNNFLNNNNNINNNNINNMNNNHINHNILHNCSHIMSYNMDYNKTNKRKHSEIQMAGSPSLPRNWHVNHSGDESNGSNNSNHSRPSVIKFSPIEAKKTAMNLEELEFFNKFFCLNKLEEIFRSEIESDSHSPSAPGAVAVDDKLAVKCENSDPKEDTVGACRALTAAPIDPTPVHHVLNDLEMNRMKELGHAFVAAMGEEDRLSPNPEAQPHQHMDAVQMTDNAVRRLIQMIKKINGYKNLCQHDQIALMKAGCTEIIILRSVQTYNFERDFWSIVKDSKNPTLIKLDALKPSLRPCIFEAHKRFMAQIGHEWDKNLDILNLLSTIVLFDPNRPNIIHKDMIAFEHQINKYLLKRYLEINCGSKCEARDKYERLMKTLDDLHTLNEENVRYHLEVDPREIGPLLIELFDLKH